MKKFIKKFLSLPTELKIGSSILIGLLVISVWALFHKFDPVMARITAENTYKKCLEKPSEFFPPNKLPPPEELEKRCDNRNLKPFFLYWLSAVKDAVTYLFQNREWHFVPPKIPHQYKLWLGSDDAGVPLSQLLIESTEAFFLPGLLATLIAVLGGVLIGALSGYFGGIIAALGRYIVILISSFPSLILVLLCTTIFGPDMNIIAAVVGITFIPHVSEEIRRKVIQLKAEEFVLAAKAHGLRDSYILFYHIVWLHCTPLILRQISFMWGYLVILETSLNYLGRGVLQKGPSWGKLLYDFRDGIFSGDWKAVLVIATVMVAMAGFYLTAKGLQKYTAEKK